MLFWFNLQLEIILEGAQAEEIPGLGDGGEVAADKTAALTVDTSQSQSASAASSLSIQFNPKSSKFNLKIGSPIMRGNIFQKYKARNEAPAFNKHADQGDRKYRKNTGKEGDAVNVDDDDDDEDEDDENDPKTKEQLLKMLGIEAPATAAAAVKKEAVSSNYELSSTGKPIFGGQFSVDISYLGGLGCWGFLKQGLQGQRGFKSS